MSASLSRRIIALALFCAALFGAMPTNSWAQRTAAAQTGAVPLRNRPFMTGDTRFLPTDVTRRSLKGVTGFDANAPGSSRVRVGGTNGQDVQEQIVDITVPYVDTNEITPFWSADERYLFYASNQSVGDASGAFPNAVGPGGRYRLFRITANATDFGVTPGAARIVPDALTNPADTRFDYLYPTVNGDRIAFIRSEDGKAANDPTKVWHLFVSQTPNTNGTAPAADPSAGTRYINTIVGVPNGLDLRGLTAQPGTASTASTARNFYPGGDPAANVYSFQTVGRPTWYGSDELIFSARLRRPDGTLTPWHLFQVNISTNRFFQLTDGLANERNPAVDPYAQNVAFDSDAAATLGPNGAEGYPTAGTPLLGLTVPTTGQTIPPLPGTRPTTASSVSATGNRNIFTMRLTPSTTGNIAAFTARQFTNRQTGATESDNIEPAWSSQVANIYTNPAGGGVNSAYLYLGWASTRVTTGAAGGPSTPHDVYFDRASTTSSFGNQSLILPEGTLQPTIKLETIDLNNVYDDRNPTFAPFTTIFRIGFQSDRNGNYVTSNFPISPSGSDGRGFTKKSTNDIFIASVIDINAPTLIRFNTNSATGEVVHINLVTDPNQPYQANRSVRSREDGLLPGSTVHFAVRVDDRESGLRPDQAVFIQIKNPNGKYQTIQQGSSNPVEHKEYLNSINQTLDPTKRNGQLAPGTGTRSSPPISYSTTFGSPPSQIPLWGLTPAADGSGNPSYGPEYEAEAIGVVNNFTTINGVVVNKATASSTYFQHRFGIRPNRTTPEPTRFLYEAGTDDFAAFGGVTHAPLTKAAGADDDVWLELKPLYQRNADGSFATNASGQPIPESSSDGQGGVLYGASLTLPNEASDWYIDVILYDNAVNPFNTAQSSNFIIYDNVWGFSTATPISGASPDILVVADYTLGQKFFNSRFSNTGVGNNNLLPIRFGGESYMTDADLGLIRQLIGQVAAIDNTTLYTYSAATVGTTTISPFGIFDRTPGIPGSPNDSAFPIPLMPHALGLNSYNDVLLANEGVVFDQGFLPNVGRYNIWRVLSRGPVPRSLLQSYLPRRTTAPADVRTGVNETAPRSVLDVQKLVVWSAPFSGNVFPGPGTILDLQTQNDLTDYVNQGGRLFISGQDIAFALTSNGQQVNPFLRDVLQAQFVRDNAATPGLVAAGSAGAFPYSLAIQQDPWTSDLHLYTQVTGTNPFRQTTNRPNAGLEIVSVGLQLGTGNDVGDAAFTTLPRGGGVNDVVTAAPTTAGSANNPRPSAYPEFNYDNGGTAMLSSTYGSGYTVYAAFGFESLSNGWYFTGASNGNAVQSFGRRAQIMHNIDCALRTGSITGRLIDNNGAPVPGALVRAVASIAAEANAAAGTALTDRDGNFTVVGLHPDRYVIFGYKPGFYTQHSDDTLMHGASRSQINLQLKVANPGALTGAPLNTPGAPSGNQGGVFRTDQVTPIPNAAGEPRIEVQARLRNPDGTYTVLSALTSDGITPYEGLGVVLPKGAYRFPTLLIGDYIVIANAKKTYAADGVTLIDNPNYRPDFSTVVVTTTANSGFATTATILPGPVLPDDGVTQTGLISITESNTTQVNFFLSAAPQRISGRVVGLRDANGSATDPANQVPVANAVVLARIPGTTTDIASGVTDANGNYTLTLISAAGAPNPSDLTLISAGTYEIRISSAPGYSTTTPPSPVTQVTVVLTSTTPATAPDLVLSPLPPGSASGLVTFSLTGTDAGAPNGVGGTVVNLYAVISVNGTETIATTPSYTTTVSDTPTTTNGYTFNWRITGIAPGDYVVQLSPIGGLSANPSQQRITVATGAETQNVNFRLEPPKVYSPGLQLISLPLDLPGIDPRRVFTFAPGADTTFKIADWTGTDYKIADDNAELSQPLVDFRLGKGYFVRFGSTAAFNPGNLGTRLTTPTFDVQLVSGWNIIGHPFANQTNPGQRAADLVLNNPAQATYSYVTTTGVTQNRVSLDQAVADGVVQRNAYAFLSNFNGTAGGYVAQGTIEPYFGYWFRAFVPVTITFAYPGASTRAQLVKVNGKYATVTRAALDTPVTRSITSRGLTDWKVQLAVRQGDYGDTDNSVGVSPNAKDGFDNGLDSEKPPINADAPGVYVKIDGKGADGRATSLTDNIVAAGAGKKSWTFTVETTVANGGDVTLYWPNISRLPRGLEPILIDKANGRRVAMRSGAGSYRFATGGRARHQFAIEVAPPSSLPLDIINLHTTSRSQLGYNGNSVSVHFATTREADVEVEVKTFTGRSVRRIQTRAQSGAETSLTWDYRDTTGSKVPAGAYVLSVTARDGETGATVRRQVQVMSLR